MTAPAAPVITAPADGSTLSGTTVSMSGTSEADGSIMVYDGSETVGTATSAAGSWSATFSLNPGDHSLWVTVGDGENVSDSSNEVHVTVPAASDAPSTAPDAAQTDPPSPLGSDGIPVLGDTSTTDDAAPGPADLTADPPAAVDPSAVDTTASPEPTTPEATAVPAAGDAADPTAVEIPPTTAVDGSEQTDPDTSSQVDVPSGPILAPGQTPAPNLDETTDPSTEVVPGSTTDDSADSGAPNPQPTEVAASDGPAASTDPIATPDAPIIEVPHDGQEIDESLVEVSGTAEPSGATVTVWADSRPIGTASVDDTGNWKLEATLPNAQYRLSATVDEVGHVSVHSDDVNITVNFDSTVVPPAPADDKEAFLRFVKERVLRGYPLNWEFIQELRRLAELWVAFEDGEKAGKASVAGQTSVTPPAGISGQ